MPIKIAISHKVGNGLFFIGMFMLFVFFWQKLASFLIWEIWLFYPAFYLSVERHASESILMGVCSIGAFSLLGFLFMRLDKEALFTLRDRYSYSHNKAGMIYNLMKGFAWGSLIQLLYVAMIWLWGGYRIIGYYNLSYISIIVVGSLLIPVLEEIAFRGYLLQRLENKYGAMPALIISSLVFGVYHVGFGNEWHSSAYVIQTLLRTSPLGFMFGAAFLNKHDIRTSVGLHWGWNCTTFLFFDAYTKYHIPSLFHITYYRPIPGMSGIGYGVGIGIVVLTGVYFWLTREKGSAFSLQGT